MSDKSIDQNATELGEAAGRPAPYAPIDIDINASGLFSTYSPEEKTRNVAAAMDKAVAAFRNRPANLRDPESKKVKCQQCGRRMELKEFREHKDTVRPSKNLPKKKKAATRG